jgi:hypothetical protein
MLYSTKEALLEHLEKMYDEYLVVRRKVSRNPNQVSDKDARRLKALTEDLAHMQKSARDLGILSEYNNEIARLTSAHRS